MRRVNEISIYIIVIKLYYNVIYTYTLTMVLYISTTPLSMKFILSSKINYNENNKNLTIFGKFNWL